MLFHPIFDLNILFSINWFMLTTVSAEVATLKMQTFSWKDARFLTLGINTVLIALYLLCMVKYGGTFSKYRKEISLYKRYAEMTIRATYCCMMELSFAWIFEVSDTFCYLEKCLYGYHWIMYLRQAAWLLFLICNQVVYHYFIVRYWILYYQMMIIQAEWNDQWKKVISNQPKYLCSPRPQTKPRYSPRGRRKFRIKKNYDGFNWFEENQNRYGNVNWVWNHLFWLSLIPLIIIGPVVYCTEPLIFGFKGV